jgi:hypothetical protein
MLSDFGITSAAKAAQFWVLLAWLKPRPFKTSAEARLQEPRLVYALQNFDWSGFLNSDGQAFQN